MDFVSCAPNKSLQATRDGALSSASRFTVVIPACLSSGRSASIHIYESNKSGSYIRHRINGLLQHHESPRNPDTVK
jgi:hypothetical protein